MAVQVNIAEAKAKLSSLLDQALAGEEVVIASAGKPLARLTPVDSMTRCRRPGVYRIRCAELPLPPFAGGARRMAEIAWYQTGLEPGHECVDAEHRQAQPLGERAGVGHHIGAFDKDSADIRVARDE